MAPLRATMISLFAILFPMAAAAGEIVGHTVEVKGSAVAQAGHLMRSLDASSNLELDDTVLTGANAKLSAVLGSSTKLFLSGDARLVIDRYVAGVGGNLVLSSGALLVDAAAKSFRKPLTVTSPYGIVGIRGTRFFAGTIGETFGVFCARGSVSVTAGGRTVLLGAGQGVDIARPGASPGPVRAWGAAKIARALALVR